jgi:hypothetical protein
MSFTAHFRNRNLATPEFHFAIRAAIQAVLSEYDLLESRVEDYEPFIGNVSYDIVKGEYEEPEPDGGQEDKGLTGVNS